MKATVAEKREVAKGTLLVALRGRRLSRLPARRLLLGRAARPRPPGRERAAPPHLARDLAHRAASVGLATRLRDSAFKRTLAELEVGDEVEVEEPKGSFLLPEDTSAEYVFVAGGIGITVFRSMLRYIADEQLPYRVTLVYSNRDRESAAFLDELEELERRIEGLRVVLTMTDEEGWEGRRRRIDADVLARALGDLDGKPLPRRRPARDGRGGVRVAAGRGVPEQV